MIISCILVRYLRACFFFTHISWPASLGTLIREFLYFSVCCLYFWVINYHQRTPPYSQFFWTLIMGCLHQVKRHQGPITILLKIHALKNNHQRKSNGNSGTNMLCHRVFILSEHIYTQYIQIIFGACQFPHHTRRVRNWKPTNQIKKFIKHDLITIYNTV